MFRLWAHQLSNLNIWYHTALECLFQPSGVLSANWNWQQERFPNFIWCSCMQRCYSWLKVFPILHPHKCCDPLSGDSVVLSAGYVLLSVLLIHMDWSVWIFARASLPILGGLPVGIQHACLHRKGQNGNDKAIAILSALPWKHRHGCLSQG